MADEDSLFDVFFDALEPVIAVILDVLPFPINAIVGFIYGGIEVVLTEVFFE